MATEFVRVFEREVRVQVIPRDQWIPAYQQEGFSEISARSFAAMTRLVLDQKREQNHKVVRGETTLANYFDERFGRGH